ncbi:MAG: hypothetical protein HZB53_14120 [Chloroflexi bacterium]|nr:hypothetical protein [Chloroflexota bacterium]
MKKQLIIALVLTLVVVAFVASPASADNGPHGGFTPTTDGCAGCHRAHTGVGTPLLKASSIYALCTACHGVTAGGANTDVLDGKNIADSKALKGGGFNTTFMNTTLAVAAPGAAIASTSQHKVNGMAGYAADILWGNGAIGSGAGPSVTLECSSCHDPHGKAGSGSTATYRILRSTPDLTQAAGVADVADSTAKVYTVSDTANKYYGQKYPSATDTDADNGKIAAITAWCTTCHTRLHAVNAADSGDAIYKYRHQTNGTNVATYAVPTSAGDKAPACLTCHVAHGTSAAMSTYSAGVMEPGSTTTAMGASLLRVDNRGVCQQCHNK